MASKWMRRMLIHGEGDRYGQPYTLLPWQVEFLWRWFELDPTAGPELWWFIEALIGAERGAVKTEFIAGLSHLETSGPRQLRRESTPIVHIAAASYEQAGELFRQAQIMAGGAQGQEVPAAPLCGIYNVFDKLIEFRDGRPGRIERLAAVAGTNEGGKSSLFIGDELAQWTGRKAEVFTVVAAATTKRTPPGRVIGISMAGQGKGSTPPKDTDSLLWRLYARGLLERDDPGSRFLMDWVAADERWNLDDPDQCRAALRQMRGADITWSVEVRAREILSRKITRYRAKQLYLCQWTEASANSWLLEIPGVWEECAAKPDEQARPLDGDEVVVGVDMALRHDSVGVIVAGRLPDGRVGWAPYHWAPEGGRIDHLDVFATIAGPIAQRWKIRGVTYDPRFFEIPARLLEDQGIAAIEFPQSPERMCPADGLLFDALKDHQIVHPDDAVLNAHASNAAWREQERGRYLSKGLSAGHMDLIRAGSMATWELLAGDVPTEERGPILW